MPETPLQQQLRGRMQALGLKQKNLAKLAGLNETAVRDILKGRSKNPRVDTLEALADVLGCTVLQLVGKPSEGDHDARSEEVPVIGAARTDYIRETPYWPKEERYPLWLPRDERWPGVHRFALEVDDQSMNEYYRPGDLVVCVSLGDVTAAIQNGQRVVVHRIWDGRIEVTVRGCSVGPLGPTMLWPKTDVPRLQTPQQYHPEDPKTRIVALVVASVRTE